MAKAKKQRLGPNQRKWLKALRGGKYEQGTHFLQTTDNHFCCMGVACRIFRYRFSGGAKLPPAGVERKLRLRDLTGRLLHPFRLNKANCLTIANDNGTTFEQIADFIEAHPEAVFTGPK